jgi:tetratricopeptide (TPR) repeat protein
MDAKFISIIQKLISDRGKIIVNNRVVLNALLADYARGDFFSERRLFIKELETNSIDELMQKYQPKPQPVPQPVSPPVPQTRPIPAPKANSPAIDDNDDEDNTEEELGRLLKKSWKHINSGNYEKAEKTFNKIIRIAPDCGYAYHGLGVVAANNGDLNGAIDYLKDAIRFFDTQGDTEGVRDCKDIIKELKELKADKIKRQAENEENIKKIVTNAIDIFLK